MFQSQIESDAVAPPDVQGQYLASIQYLVHEGNNRVISLLYNKL